MTDRVEGGYVLPKRNGEGIELLADSTRRRIVALLALHPWRPSALAREIGLSRPATTRQLHILLEADLVRCGRSVADRRAILFSIEPRRHGVITAWLAGTEIGRQHRSGRRTPTRPRFEPFENVPRTPAEATEATEAP